MLANSCRRSAVNSCSRTCKRAASSSTSTPSPSLNRASSLVFLYIAFGTVAPFALPLKSSLDAASSSSPRPLKQGCCKSAWQWIRIYLLLHSFIFFFSTVFFLLFQLFIQKSCHFFFIIFFYTVLFIVSLSLSYYSTKKK